jgi:hypothetical protein
MGIEDEFYQYLAGLKGSDSPDIPSIGDHTVGEVLGVLGFLASMEPGERERLRELFQQMSDEMPRPPDLHEPTDVLSDLLFVGTDGRRVVKGFHYSREVLGQDGPVILPSSSEFVIMGAFADEFVQETAHEIESSWDTYEEQSNAWEMQMADFAHMIAAEYDKNPPGRLDDFFKNIN